MFDYAAFRLSIVVLLLVYSSVQVAGQGTPTSGDTEEKHPYAPRGIAGGRNLNQYDRGGDLDAGMGLESESYGIPPTSQEYQRTMRALAQVRAFVWEHWHDRRRGYITVTFHGVDSAATTHLFIEPDETGRWQIIRRMKGNRGKVFDYRPYYAMASATVVRFGMLGSYIPDDANLPADKWALVFGDGSVSLRDVFQQSDYL